MSVFVVRLGYANKKGNGYEQSISNNFRCFSNSIPMEIHPRHRNFTIFNLLIYDFYGYFLKNQVEF